MAPTLPSLPSFIWRMCVVDCGLSVSLVLLCNYCCLCRTYTRNTSPKLFSKNNKQYCCNNAQQQYSSSSAAFLLFRRRKVHQYTGTHLICRIYSVQSTWQHPAPYSSIRRERSSSRATKVWYILYVFGLANDKRMLVSGAAPLRLPGLWTGASP